MTETSASAPHRTLLAGPRSTRVPSRVLIVILCLFLLGIGAALFQAVSAERAAREQVERTTDVLTALRESLRAGVDAETGQRGFLLTDDATYLEPYERGSAAWLSAIERLDRSLDGVATPEQAASVDRMGELAQAKLDELARTIDLARAGQREEALALVRTDEGQALMEEFRTLVTRLEGEEDVILRDALNDARVVEARTLPILGFLGAAVVGLVLLGFWLERRTARAEAAARDAVEVQRARERSDLLARELNHRVKNLFAVILSIVALSGRGQTDVKEAVRSIRSRIHALSLAHAVSQGQLEAKIVSLRDVLAATLEPYAPMRADAGGSEHGDAEGRVRLAGDPVDLPVKAVTPMGLVVHELATNAAKYGALSVDDGRVEVRWRMVDGGDGREVEMVWEEHGGPPVPVERKDGFGSVMMKQAAQQLGGRIEREWLADGVRATLAFPLEGRE